LNAIQHCVIRAHMKSNALLSGVVVIMIVIISGCNLLDNLTKFNIDYSNQFTIPQGVPANIPYDLYTPRFPTNSAQYFNDNKTNPDLIEGCILKSAVASIIPPSNDDLSFIQSIHIFIIADALPQRELAYKENITGVTDTLKLDIVENELIDYIKKDSIGLLIQLYTNRVNTDDITTKMQMQFQVDAKILGI